MITETTYRANDGSVFLDRNECLSYEAALEKSKAEELEAAMADLDEQLWIKYHPEYIIGSLLAPPGKAHIWLKNDIGAILAYINKDLELLKGEILAFIRAQAHGAVILEKYVPMDVLLREATIRRDYAAAFSKVERGSNLSGILNWSLGPKDLKSLALLHQKNKYRKKIEDLLTDCNFHYECSQFTSHKYEEFLNPKEGGQE